MTDIHGEEGDSLFSGFVGFMYKILKPGFGLDGITRAMLLETTTLLDELEGVDNGTVDLWEWVRHAITMATTESVYGPLNPYRDAEVEGAFW